MRLILLAVPLAALTCLFGACGWGPPLAPYGPVAAGPLEAPVENPLMVPVTDREFLWNQVVDTVDDYFDIEREERVKLIDGVLTEGRIETVPTTASTLLEPWARDSSPGYESQHATLQSLRRRGVVRVIPSGGGYLLSVMVHKEKEEVSQSEHATVGSSVRRHDGSLVRRDRQNHRYRRTTLGSPVTLGWIPIGRDLTLEQRILRELEGRLLDPHTVPYGSDKAIFSSRRDGRAIRSQASARVGASSR